MRLFAKQRQQSKRQEARGKRQEARGKQEERWRRGSKELGRASTSSGRHTLGTRACCVQQREGTWLGGNQGVWDGLFGQFGRFGRFGQLDWDVGCCGVPIGGRSSRQQQQQVGPPQLCTLCTLHSTLSTQHSAFSALSLLCHLSALFPVPASSQLGRHYHVRIQKETESPSRDG
jgi:hypothetical protein